MKISNFKYRWNRLESFLAVFMVMLGYTSQILIATLTLHHNFGPIVAALVILPCYLATLSFVIVGIAAYGIYQFFDARSVYDILVYILPTAPLMLPSVIRYTAHAFKVLLDNPKEPPALDEAILR